MAIPPNYLHTPNETENSLNSYKFKLTTWKSSNPKLQIHFLELILFVQIVLVFCLVVVQKNMVHKSLRLLCFTESGPPTVVLFLPVRQPDLMRVIRSLSFEVFSNIMSHFQLTESLIRSCFSFPPHIPSGKSSNKSKHPEYTKSNSCCFIRNLFVNNFLFGRI